MDIKDIEILIESLLEKKRHLDEEADKLAIREIDREIQALMLQAYENPSAWDRVYLARHVNRPKATDYIAALFDDFIEIHGDRAFKDDEAIITGLGLFAGKPVTVIAQAKGKDTQENLKRNFGMSNPEGYRKALRVAKQAEKFKRPIITFVDTAGAFPGKGAEERGQAEAIAQCLMQFSNLKTIVICVVIGEGGSGGALALSVGDRIIMLENAIYSILSPEGFASILWKDESKFREASEMMKLTANDLKLLGIVDEIIQEPLGGVQKDFPRVIRKLNNSILAAINELEKERLNVLLDKRYKKYRNIGTY